MLNKRWISIFCIILSTSIFGQDLQSLCSKEDSSTCVCVFDPTKKNGPSDKRLIYKITHPEQIPKLIRDELPIPDQEISKNSPFYISLWQDNDNIALNLIESGNDLGFSTGMQLEIGGVNRKGITYGGHLYTGLYTRRVLPVKTENGTIDYRDFSGDWTNVKKDVPLKKNEKFVPTDGEQYVKFNEDTVISAFMNNKLQGQWFLWEMKFGLAINESQKTSKLRATGIQEKWHKLLNMVDYEYVPDNNDTRYAVYLKGVVGAQNRLFNNQNCSLDISEYLGANVATSGNRNFLIGEIQANLGLINSKKYNEKKIKINVGSKANVGQLNQINANVGININFHKIIITNQLMIPLTSGYSDGMATPFVDKDPIHRIGIIVPIRK